MNSLPISVVTALDAASGTVPEPGRWDTEMLALTGQEAEPHPLTVWASLGERWAFVALPLPGRPGLLPPGNRDLTDAAMAAGECLFSPTLGEALVPQVETRGTAYDSVDAVSWRRFACSTTDPRRIGALDPAAARQDLHVAITRCIEELGRVDEVSLADLGDIIDHHSGPQARLPHAVPGRLAGLIELADRVCVAADAGLDPRAATVSSHATLLREAALRDLLAVATGVLEEATNLAVLELARGR